MSEPRVVRYRCTWARGLGEVTIEEDGEWVTYEDYARLSGELETVRESMIRNEARLIRERDRLTSEKASWKTATEIAVEQRDKLAAELESMTDALTVARAVASSMEDERDKLAEEVERWENESGALPEDRSIAEVVAERGEWKTLAQDNAMEIRVLRRRVLRLEKKT